jgi:hypothetical protein
MGHHSGCPRPFLPACDSNIVLRQMENPERNGIDFGFWMVAELQHPGDMTTGVEKLLLLSGAMLLGQVWLYFSAIALLVRNMREGYMYAVTLGFIELIQAIVIVIAFSTHHFGSSTDYLAFLKGLLLPGVALVVFKKSQTPSLS